MPAPAERSPGHKWLALIDAAIIIVALVLATLTARHTSPTADEAKHIFNGFSLRELGVAIHEETPSARLHVLGVDRNELVLPAYDQLMPMGPVPQEVLFESNPAVRESVKWHSRLATVVALAVLLVCVAWWSRQLFTPGVAQLVLALVAWNPTILAHSAVATEDLFLTTATTSAAWALWGFLQAPSYRRALLAAVMLGAVLLSKLPGLFMFVTCLLLFLVWAVRYWRRREVAPKPPRRVAIPVSALILVVVPLAVLAIGYQGRGLCLRLDELDLKAPAARRAAASVLGRVPLPIPADYIRAMDFSLTDGYRRAALGKSYSLFGESYAQAKPHYFPMTLLLKMPLLLLGLFVAGLWALARGTPRPPWTAAVLTVIPAVFLLVNVLLNPFNIGVRYLLPMVPFMAMIAGYGVLLIAARLRERWRPWLAHGLLPVPLVGALMAYPDYIGDFNASAWLVPRERLLTDSNLDWGQLNHLVTEDLRAHPAANVCVSLLGPSPLLENVRRDRGVRPCRYYVSKSTAVFESNDLMVPRLPPPVRTLGGIIDVHEVRVPADLAGVAYEDGWLVSPIVSRATLDETIANVDQLPFGNLPTVFGRVDLTPAPEIDAAYQCVLIRSRGPLTGKIWLGGSGLLAVYTPRRMRLNGGTGLFPFTRLYLPAPGRELSVVSCGAQGRLWFQALRLAD